MSARLVIGTAGHIDHGKTSLVGALTGMDTDRLAEEKRRGISIDLGFAHLTLDGGEQLSFVDVPGHERFIRNMLAGAAGIEAVLLVIAADESVKPQTREHFDICRLLNIRRGLIVLTKMDLATPEQMERAESDARELTHGSFLEGAPLIRVSARTGEGLAELKSQLKALAEQIEHRAATGLARLPVDRSFALKGFGTVVTGTLWSGVLKVGETVCVYPTKREARVRGLQRHGHAVETAYAGDRTAVNLAGIDHAEIRRGYALSDRSDLETTRTLDVSLEWLNPLQVAEKATAFLLAIGTAEVMAVLKPLRAHFGRLTLSEPVLALPGDRFVLRRPSPPLTMAGGIVIEPFPPNRLNRAKTFERLTRLEGASAAQRVELLAEERAYGLPLKQLTRLTGLIALPESADLVRIQDQLVIPQRRIEELRQRLVEWLKAFHAKNPALPGAPASQARLGVDATLFAALVNGYASVVMRGNLVALASHRVQVSDAEAKARAEIERAFRDGGFQPPDAAAFKRDLVERLIKDGRLIRIGNDIVFHADVIAHIRQSLAAHKGRRFTVPEFKSWTNVSRKYAIPLLEYLDQQRVTRRDGDARVVL